MKKVRILAIVAAVVTAVLVYLFLVNINKPTEVSTTPVVIAKHAIGEDIVITKDMLTVAELPSEAVHADAAHDISEVINKTSSGGIVENEQVITSKLIEPGVSYDSLAYAIEEGQRAITVAVDEVTGVAGLLKPQDYVDVLFTITVDKIAAEQPKDEQEEQPDEQSADEKISLVLRETYSTHLMQNIKVLAVGDILEEHDTDDGISYTTVTLSVSPEQAVKLNLAEASGEIRLILRSPLNSEISETEILTVDDLLEQN